MLQTIHQEIDRLPPEAQAFLLDFIQILKKRYSLTPKQTLQPRCKGSAKGKLIIHSEDDEHLENFSEYMLD
jgi:hypothetical protein